MSFYLLHKMTKWMLVWIFKKKKILFILGPPLIELLAPSLAKTIPGKDVGVCFVPYSFVCYAQPLDLYSGEHQVQWETASWFNGLSHHWGNDRVLLSLFFAWYSTFCQEENDKVTINIPLQYSDILRIRRNFWNYLVSSYTMGMFFFFFFEKHGNVWYEYHFQLTH